MSDVKPLDPSEMPPPPERKVEVRIILSKNGLQVLAPFDDKLLCLGMLECAKSEVERYWRDLEANPEKAQRETVRTIPGRTAAGIVIP